MIFLQEFMANEILPNLLHRLTYSTDQALQCLKSGLKHLQDLTADPILIIIPDIKNSNALVQKLLPMLPFEPNVTNQLL